MAWILLGVWFAVQAVEGILAYGDRTAGAAFLAHVGGFAAGMALAFVFSWRRAAGRGRGRV